MFDCTIGGASHDLSHCLVSVGAATEWTWIQKKTKMNTICFYVNIMNRVFLLQWLACSIFSGQRRIDQIKTHKRVNRHDGARLAKSVKRLRQTLPVLLSSQRHAFIIGQRLVAGNCVLTHEHTCPRWIRPSELAPPAVSNDGRTFSERLCLQEVVRNCHRGHSASLPGRGADVMGMFAEVVEMKALSSMEPAVGLSTFSDSKGCFIYVRAIRVMWGGTGDGNQDTNKDSTAGRKSKTL